MQPQRGRLKSWAKVGSDVRVSFTPNGLGPVIGWNGTEFTLLWREPVTPYTGLVHLDRVRADGMLVGDPRVVFDVGSPTPIQLIWTASEYGLLFSTLNGVLARDFRVGRVENDGRTSSDNLISLGYAASFDWTGSGYGMTWYEGSALAGGELSFARADSRGRMMGSRIVLAPDTAELSGSAVAWDGVGFAALYRDDATSTLQLLPLDDMGRAGAARPISSAGEEVGEFAIAASGSVLGVAYARTVAGRSDVRFTTTSR